MTFNPELSVTQGLDHLAGRLNPIITKRLPVDLGGHPWTVVLNQLDEIAGKPPKHYSATDLQAQLKMLTRRLGNMGFPFDDNKQTVGALGRELTIVRNSRAHGDPFTRLDAWRSHDFCVRLLEYFGDAEGLVEAHELRQVALKAYVDEQGIAPIPAAATVVESQPAPAEEPTALDVEVEEESEVVTPDPEVFTREPSATPSVVGNSRLAFDVWEPVVIGDVSILDDLPKKVAKEKVRAVATEIIEFEGPIHLDRLAQLVGASFGLKKLWPDRRKKIISQIKQTGLLVDDAKFVWPDGVDPTTWREFRPNSSDVDRPFLHISTAEIANAMRFLKTRNPALSADDLDRATLQTFGRKKRTKQFAAHLTKATALI